MKLDGIHHITCITADAPGNVDFYARVLGMRFVKKTVNFDAPDVYHLYYGDERGAPGSILTFFEFPDAAPGRPGAGMIHRLRWRVASDEALAFWSDRLTGEGIDVAPVDGAVRFSDPEGLDLELTATNTDDAPLIAQADDIPAEYAIQGFDGVRAYGPGREQEHTILTEAMGFTLDAPGEYRLQGRRTATYGYDDPPAAVGLQGAGTVHHIAWCDRDEEHAAWRGRLAAAGQRPTPVIDRQYFLSIYFREPHGVLFELATPSPGFAIDEDPEHLGEQLRLPPQHEHLRERLEATLTPLVKPAREGGPVMSEAICTHLDQVNVDPPDHVAGCEDCLRIGGQWVHLRVCRTCGHVGCCDSSPNRHASHHAHDTNHPIVTSVQPGEDWSYCYVDDVMFRLVGS